MSDVESNPKEDLFHFTLPWRDDDLNELIHQCDASMRLSKNMGLHLLDQNHQTSTNSNKLILQRSDFF